LIRINAGHNLNELLCYLSSYNWCLCRFMRKCYILLL